MPRKYEANLLREFLGQPEPVLEDLGVPLHSSVNGIVEDIVRRSYYRYGGYPHNKLFF